jgi:hypothetical protein
MPEWGSLLSVSSGGAILVDMHYVELFVERAVEKPGGLLGAIAGVIVGALGLFGPLPTHTDQPEYIIGFWLVSAAIGAFIGLCVQGVIDTQRGEDDA